MLEPAPCWGLWGAVGQGWAVGLGVPVSGHSRVSSTGTCLRAGCRLPHVRPSVHPSVWVRGRAGGDAVPAGSLLVPNPLTPLPWCRGGCPHIPPRGSRVLWACCRHLGAGRSRRAGGLASFCTPKSPWGWRGPAWLPFTAAPPVMGGQHGAGLGLALQLLLCPPPGLGARGGHAAGQLTPPAFPAAGLA